MKKTILSITALATFFLLQSFTNSNLSTADSVEIKNSKVVWKGYKVSGSHEGTINLKSGSLTFNDDQLSGGEFTIDMTTISCTDMEGEYKDKLEGHLKSDDFFGVEKYPTSTLVITKSEQTSRNAYKVTADLTIKGITKSVEFDASIYGKKATASLKIDRTEFNVKYGSGSFFDGLKDNLIYDEMDLVIDIEFE